MPALVSGMHRRTDDATSWFYCTMATRCTACTRIANVLKGFRSRRGCGGVSPKGQYLRLPKTNLKNMQHISHRRELCRVYNWSEPFGRHRRILNSSKYWM